jgi:hypothetical protein
MGVNIIIIHAISGNMTDDSNCDEHLGVQARVNKKRRNDIVDEMRSFTAYASIRLQVITNHVLTWIYFIFNYVSTFYLFIDSDLYNMHIHI